MKLQLFFTSTMYVLLGGILFHFLIGNSPEVILNDLKNAGSQLAGYICLVVAVFLLRLTYYAVKNRRVFERNRQATVLLRQFLSGGMTDGDQQKLTRFRQAGVLTFNSNGVLRLSDQAVNDLFR